MPASVELVKIALKAYADGYSEIALALAGPAIRWDERASRTDAGLVQGRDEVQGAMRSYLEGWREYAFELEDVAEVAPGNVAGICRERGIDPAGSPVDRRFGALWVVEGSRIVSWSTFATPREAVRAAKRRGRAAQRSGGEQSAPSRETAAAKRETAATEQPAAEKEPESASTEQPSAAPEQASAPPEWKAEPESVATGGAEQPPASAQPRNVLTDERRRRAAKARARLQRQRLAS